MGLHNKTGNKKLNDLTKAIVNTRIKPLTETKTKYNNNQTQQQIKNITHNKKSNQNIKNSKCRVKMTQNSDTRGDQTLAAKANP